MAQKNSYIGKWRITEMEEWDQDYVDMETEGYFEFSKNKTGYFHFGLVQGQIDYRIETVAGAEILNFTWEGQDENDECHGRGWAVIKNDSIEGRIYFHEGEDSGFKAERNP